MKLAVGIVTHNALAALRVELLEETFESVLAGFPTSEVFLLDNGSTDDTGALIEPWAKSHAPRVHLRRYEPRDGNHTPGRGRNVLLDWMMVEADADVIVFSDDDMAWKPTSEEVLLKIWSAPVPAGGRAGWREGDDWNERIVIVGGLLEPEWHWNAPRRTVRPNGVPVLVRDSTPGAAWSFRARSVCHGTGRVLLPAHGIAAYHRYLEETHLPVFKEDFGYDYAFCRQLANDNLFVGQLDLSTHLGWEVSTHGNEAIKDGKPLDRDKWGV